MFGLRRHTGVDKATFEQIVESLYEPLYRFALSLTHREADACDLTQETFQRLATRGHQLRDPAKVKTWLFTVLHRRFLSRQRKEHRFPHFELSVVRQELPSTWATAGEEIDGASARQALQQLDEMHRLPLVLFYLEEHSYAEIAQILNIPIGTVMSRIARGRAMLRRRLTGSMPQNDWKGESGLAPLAEPEKAV